MLDGRPTLKKKKGKERIPNRNLNSRGKRKKKEKNGTENKSLQLPSIIILALGSHPSYTTCPLQVSMTSAAIEALYVAMGPFEGDPENAKSAYARSWDG